MNVSFDHLYGDLGETGDQQEGPTILRNSTPAEDCFNIIEASQAIQ